ncbi:MAG: AAA family ATPase, partial [Anaerolineae bacterium]
GHEVVVRAASSCHLPGRHAWLEGVTCVVKTMLSQAGAAVLDLDFPRVRFAPDLMPADIVGTDILEETEDGRREFRFQSGPIFANLVLADEINRATPKTQSAMLEAMQEKTVTVAGRQYPLEKPFFVLATQNPLDMEGTYPLPEAQLDRFLFKVDVQFPSVDELVSIINRTTGIDQPSATRVASANDILRMGQLALSIPVASHLNQYVARLIVATHPESDQSTVMVRQFVSVGASPRGAQALIIGAKVNALLEGRFNVAYADIEAVAHGALRHRLLLNFEGQAEGIRTDDIITDLLSVVKKK